jgi:hypothetical protein
MRENALARWAHAQEEPPDTDWQRGYEAARRWVRQVGLPSLAQQEAPKGGGNLPPPLQAEPVQEPVAWRYKGMMGMPWSLSDDGYYVSCKRDNGYMVEPLYTTPPRREWQSLSEEEIDRWTPEIHPVIRAIEQALKEKNA